MPKCSYIHAESEEFFLYWTRHISNIHQYLIMIAVLVTVVSFPKDLKNSDKLADKLRLRLLKCWSLFILSFIYLVIYLFIHSFIHSFINLFIYLFIYSFIYLVIYLFVHLLSLMYIQFTFDIQGVSDLQIGLSIIELISFRNSHWFNYLLYGWKSANINRSNFAIFWNEHCVKGD